MSIKQQFNSFEDVITSTDIPVLVGFYGPCQMMAELAQVNEQMKGQLKIIKIDTNKYPKIAAQHRIEILPTLILFKDGQPVDRIEEVLSTDKLLARLENNLDSIDDITSIPFISDVEAQELYNHIRSGKAAWPTTAFENIKKLNEYFGDNWKGNYKYIMNSAGGRSIAEEKYQKSEINRVYKTEVAYTPLGPQIISSQSKEQDPFADLGDSETKELIKIHKDSEVLTINIKGEIVNRKTINTCIFRENIGNIDIDLALIPGGSFVMGSSLCPPEHQVNLSDFYMGIYPITQSQYIEIMGNLPARRRPFKGENYPVERVNWNEATEFCQRLSKKTGRVYRLPSESEWEYACRAGTTTPFHFGPTLTTDIANYDGNCVYESEKKSFRRKGTTEVGSFSCNSFGLYDMHGNVNEWCADHVHKNYINAPADGSAWGNGEFPKLRVVRGGCWNTFPAGCRSDAQHCNAVDDDFKGIYSHNNGFRVVLSKKAHLPSGI